MSKTLVLAEKPSVGRDIAGVLNCKQKQNGYLEGDKYIVTWALGHLVTLADPEEYEEKYKNWRIEDLPMLPPELKLVTIRQTAKQYNVVKSQLHRKDVKEIVIATDAGREGELVARWILERAKINKPLKRLWISSVTDKAIQEGFKKLKSGKEYEKLYASAVARAEADWLVGINATRALTCKYNAQLSCGRVQTPTLAIIRQREEEIRLFKPRKYFGITAEGKGVKLVWQDSITKEYKTFDQGKRDKVFHSLQGQKINITAIEKSYKKSMPPGLYNLTELQRDANRIFGFGAKETLGILQKLYETHKLVTYPRTDSRYLSSDIVGTLKDRLQACGVGENAKYAAQILKNPIKANKSFVDDSKVSDHHALIPTEKSAGFVTLSDKERKIYNLVLKRFFAVLYPPFEYEQTTIKSKIGSENFIAKGKVVLKQGWKAIYDASSEDEEGDELAEQVLPSLKQGDVLKLDKLKETGGETKPPAYFTEGSLLQAMENPAKYMETSNKDLIKTIGEVGGIGTVATRADIIEKLLNSFLLEKKGKDLHLTSKGKQLLELVPADLKSPQLTAEWEQKLISIAQGKLGKDNFLNEMRQYTKVIVSEIKKSEERFTHDNLTRDRCPECGKYMLAVKGKKGKLLVCQDRECGYRKSVALQTNARCPNCHKKLELRGEGEGKLFVCPCGYREKLGNMQERRKKDSGKVSKKDVSNFLRSQQKEAKEPLNSDLADALAKLKL